MSKAWRKKKKKNTKQNDERSNASRRTHCTETEEQLQRAIRKYEKERDGGRRGDREDFFGDNNNEK